MASPLDSVRADDIARYLAERNSRVYSLEEVAELTGFALRPLQRKCRAGELKHVHNGRTIGMTLRQIDLLVELFESGETASAPVSAADEDQEARELSRRSAARRSPGRAA